VLRYTGTYSSGHYHIVRAGCRQNSQAHIQKCRTAPSKSHPPLNAIRKGARVGVRVGITTGKLIADVAAISSMHGVQEATKDGTVRIRKW